MIKRLLSRIIAEDEWPIWNIPLVMLGVFLLSGVLVYLVYFGPTIRDLRGLSYAPTNDPARVQIEVGGALFAIPAHYTRNAQTRRGNELDYAELHALLPDMQPWREAAADSFLNTSKDAQLILISLRAMQRDMAQARIFEALYQPYIIGTGAVRDDGLQSFRFRDASPYANKEIFRALTAGSREQRATAALIICDIETHPNASCESRFDIGKSAQASYTFKRAYLSEWEATDRLIKDLIRNFRAAARTNN